MNRTLDSLRRQRHECWRAWVLADDPNLLSDDRRVQWLGDVSPSELDDRLANDQAPLLTHLRSGETLDPRTLDLALTALVHHPEWEAVTTDEDECSRKGKRTRPLLRDSGSWNDDAWKLGRTATRQHWGSHEPWMFHFSGALAGRRSPASCAIGHVPGFLVHRRHRVQLQVPSMSLRWARHRQPLISAIIPSRNRLEDISKCLDGLLARTSYPRLEVIVVDNESDDQRVFSLYRRCEGPEFKVVTWRAPFNYSAACNWGARHARGDVLLFLNNDVFVRREDWLERLLDGLEQPGIAIAGPKLLFPSGRIQHAGVALVGQGKNLHVYRGMKWGERSIFCSPHEPRRVSALTGACQLLTRRAFEQVGGYDERFELCYSDLALCVALSASVGDALYEPGAVLVHNEGSTRATVDDRERRDRVRFEEFLASVGFVRDPHFHPFLSEDHAIPRLRAPGEPIPSDSDGRSSLHAGLIGPLRQAG